MKKVLIAVDDTKGTKKAFSVCGNVCSCMRPDNIVLVYVEKFEGRSLIDEMLGDAELSTLEEVLNGSEYQEILDKKAQGILDYYKKTLEGKGITGIKTVLRKGHPAEEILKVAKKENADMIIVGSRGRRTSHLFMGSVSREVANNAEVPVLLVK
ncbi:MAG TPA: universal stress protein [Dissulfurispiraceae bacterium]